MSDSKLLTIHKGFLAGLGLIVPIAAAVCLGNYLTQMTMNMLRDSERARAERTFQPIDIKKDIVIKEFRDQKLGNKINIVGTLANNSDKDIGSISLEAEFFNAKGEFVYERSEYITHTIPAKGTENFQITCGCSDQVFPEYETVTVKVVDAGGY
jgi:uncharacterized protein with ACT and thioredoxin-like domain